MKFFYGILDRLGLSRPQDIDNRIKKESEFLDRAIEVECKKVELTEKKELLEDLKAKNATQSGITKAADKISRIMEQLDDSKESNDQLGFLNF